MSFQNHADNGLTFTYAPKALVAPHQAWIAFFEDGPEVTAVKSRFSAPRIYGALDVLVPELMAEEPHTDKRIPLNSETDEDRQAAKEWTAWKRSTTKAAKARLLPILSALLGREVDPKDLTFSVKAGCSCPCSPGFIYKGFGLSFQDLHLS